MLLDECERGVGDLLPATKTIDCNPDAFARSLSYWSWAVVVVMPFSLVANVAIGSRRRSTISESADGLEG